MIAQRATKITGTDVDENEASQTCAQIISNCIEVPEEPVPLEKKISHCAVKFGAGEENRMIY